MLVQGQGVVEWVVARAEGFAPSAGAVGIGWTSGDVLTSGVMFEEFTEASIHATIVVEKGAVMARDFIYTIFHYPFEQLGVKKIIVQMSEGNTESRKLAEHFGFELEARIKDAYLDGDRLIYTMPVEKCTWLERLKNGQESKDTQGT